MNVFTEVSKIKNKIADLNLRLSNIRRTSGTLDLDDLGDVNVPAPNDQEVLTYIAAASEWQAKAAGGGASESGIQFLDNFNDGARHWGWYDDQRNGTIGEAGPVCTIAVANGVDGRLGDGGRHRGPHAILGHPGAPFEFKCKLNSYAVNDYTHAGLLISNYADSGIADYWYFFGRARDSNWALNGLSARASGSWQTSNAVQTLPIYLRLRITSLNLSGYLEAAYSTDDITYNILESCLLSVRLVNANMEGLCVGLFASNGVIGSGVYNAISAPFDWFYMRRSFGPG